MRIAAVHNRATLIRVTEDGLTGLDVAKTSHGRYGSNVLDLLEDWESFRQWASGLSLAELTEPVDRRDLTAPVQSPRQVFAIGMNYKDHATEVSIDLPESPSVFTKFVSSITGPEATVELPSDSVDWEVEMVAVIGRGGRNIEGRDAWAHVAGLMVGQDLSDRREQFKNAAPQFSLAKSYAHFTPTGPWITTLDEVPDPAKLRMRCARGDQVLQDGTTANLLFDVPTLIAYLSSISALLPGDLIFTGTPDGVGFGRTPAQYLQPGDRLVSSIEGLGSIEQTFRV
jgi:2,4-didehydro-3-deoxy-L-rhamnonate hydrolase